MRPTPASLLVAMLLAATTAGLAQLPPGRPGPAPRPAQEPGQQPDPLMGNLFPPELIMQNQQALGLSDEQRSYMLAEIQRTQTQASPIAWRLQAAMEQLGTTVRQDRADEAQVLTQLDSVLAVEREMKRAQIALLVRLKGRLTPEQQAFLRGRMAGREE
jgi:Spy/CpxP family protein refolding chaperone